MPIYLLSFLSSFTFLSFYIMMIGKITLLIMLLGIFAGYVTTSLFGLLGIPMTFAIVYFYARWLRRAFLDDDASSRSSSSKIGMRYDREHKHLRFSPFRYRCARCKALIPAVLRECIRCNSKEKYVEF